MVRMIVPLMTMVVTMMMMMKMMVVVVEVAPYQPNSTSRI